jgi:hypothetical protein
VRPNCLCLAGRLDHQHGILCGIEVLEYRTGKTQLVAKDKDQMAHKRGKKVVTLKYSILTSPKNFRPFAF